MEWSLQKNRQHCASCGFSLIELVIVIALSGILMMAVAEIIRYSVDSTQHQYKLDYLVSEQQFAMQRITRDLQQIRSNQVTDLLIMTADDIRFVDQRGNIVEYRLVGNDLQLNTWDIAKQVSIFRLNYYDRNGRLTTIAANVRYINVTLSVQDGATTFASSSTIFLRNIRK